MTTPVFRTASAADVPGLLRFIEEFHRADGHPFDEAVVLCAVETLIANPGFGQIWLICDGERPVGYAVLGFGYSIEFHGRDAFVDELYLAPGYRKRGWGYQTLQHLETVAHGLGIKALHLEVTRNNDAYGLYERFGFRNHNRYLMTKWIKD